MKQRNPGCRQRVAPMFDGFFQSPPACRFSNHIKCQALNGAPWAQTALAPWVTWTVRTVRRLPLSVRRPIERISWSMGFFDVQPASGTCENIRYRIGRIPKAKLLSAGFWLIATHIWDDFKKRKTDSNNRRHFPYFPKPIVLHFSKRKVSPRKISPLSHLDTQPRTSQRWAPRSEGDWPHETWTRFLQKH